MNKNPETKQLKPFKKGHDPRRNTKGRPKNLTKALKEQLEQEIEGITQEDIESTFKLLLNCNEEDFDKLLNKKEVAYWVKIIVREFKETNKGFDALQKIFDRMFGKAMETIKTENKTEVSFESEEEARKYLERLRKINGTDTE